MSHANPFTEFSQSGKNFCYRIKAVKRLQKFSPICTFGLILYLFIAILASFLKNEIIYDIFISISTGFFIVLFQDLVDFERNEAFIILFMKCIKSIGLQVIPECNTTGDGSMDKKKISQISNIFHRYYDEIFFYINNLYISSSIIKDIMDLKKSFEKLQDDEQCDLKKVFAEIKAQYMRLDEACSERYGFILERATTPGA